MMPLRSPSLALLALLPAAGLALGGLGLAMQAALHDAAPIAPLPAAQPSGATDEHLAPPPSWPALFGTEAPAPVALPETLPTEPDPEPWTEIDTSLYTLRGLLSDAEGDGLAVIETPSGVVFVKPGDTLEGGILVGEILDTGVELLLEDLVALLEFEESARTPWIGPPAGAVYATPPGSLDEPSYPSYTPGETETQPPRNLFGITR